MTSYGDNIYCKTLNGLPVGSITEDPSLSDVLTKGNSGGSKGITDLGSIAGATTVGCTSVTATGFVNSATMTATTVTGTTNVATATLTATTEAKLNRALIGTLNAEEINMEHTGGVTIIAVKSLPTSDPGTPGQFWDDAGTLKISQ